MSCDHWFRPKYTCLHFWWGKRWVQFKIYRDHNDLRNEKISWHQNEFLKISVEICNFDKSFKKLSKLNSKLPNTEIMKNNFYLHYYSLARQSFSASHSSMYYFIEIQKTISQIANYTSQKSITFQDNTNTTHLFIRK